MVSLMVMFFPRSLCKHIREYRSGNPTLLEQHLCQLVAVDDSCQEVIEYVQLLLSHGESECRGL